MVMGSSGGNHANHMGVILDSGVGGSCNNDDNGEEEVVEEDNDDKTAPASGGGSRQRGPTMTRRATEEPSLESMQPPSY